MCGVGGWEMALKDRWCGRGSRAQAGGDSVGGCPPASTRTGREAPDHRHGFSEASYYLWRSKFGGMNVSDAKHLKALEAENARLKKLLAESVLENEVTREALRKKC